MTDHVAVMHAMDNGAIDVEILQLIALIRFHCYTGIVDRYNHNPTAEMENDVRFALAGASTITVRIVEDLDRIMRMAAFDARPEE